MDAHTAQLLTALTIQINSIVEKMILKATLKNHNTLIAPESFFEDGEMEHLINQGFTIEMPYKFMDHPNKDKVYVSWKVSEPNILNTPSEFNLN